MASQPQPPSSGQSSDPGLVTASGEGSTPDQPPAQPPAPAQTPPAGAEPPRSEPGFRARGRLRRRLSYLRTVRELSYRDLGGLMFDLHRFGGRRDELLSAKLARLGEVDGELRAIEKTLNERQPVTVLREAGVLACLRCAAIHSSEDNFCPHCGLSASPSAERPLTDRGRCPDLRRRPPPRARRRPRAPPRLHRARRRRLPPPEPQAPPPQAPPPTQPPMPAHVATPPAPGADADGTGQPGGSREIENTTVSGAPPASGDDIENTVLSHAPGEAADAGTDQPTQVIRRPEPPEGSSAG